MDPVEIGTRLYAVPGDSPNTLNLYPDRVFDQFANELHDMLEHGSGDLAEEEYAQLEKFAKMFFATATPLDIDAQNRVVLPQRLIDLVELSRLIVMVGEFDHMVLWNREQYGEFMKHHRNDYSNQFKKARRHKNRSTQERSITATSVNA